MALAILDNLIKKVEQSNNDTNYVFHITGFGKFGDILHNPTTYLVEKYLPNALKHNIKSSNIHIKSMKVLHVSGKNSLKMLHDIRKYNETIDISNKITIYLHLGVYAGSKEFNIETTSYNCATFKNPDELGWSPIKEMIIQQHGNINHELKCKLNLNKLYSLLLKKNVNYKMNLSKDPGRYVCNWIYYHSNNLTKNINNEYSLFIHVPLFKDINHDIQTQFIFDVLQFIPQCIH